MARGSVVRGCRRSLLCPPATPSATGIWITDAILVQAIERYTRRFSSQCRHIAFRPGPLESRRRANKRHITGYMSQPDVYPQTWSFDIYSPSQWVWEAPTTPKQRFAPKGKKRGIAALSNSLLAWLEGAEAPTPFLTPPADERGTDVDVPVDNASRVPSPIAQLKTALMGMEQVDRDALLALTRECAARLQSQIEGGLLASDEICCVADPFTAAEKLHMAGHDVEQEATLVLRRAVRAGIRSMSSATKQKWSDKSWLQLFATGSTLAARNDDASGALARAVVSAMPARVQRRIPEAVLFPFWASMLRAKSVGMQDFGPTAVQAWALGQRLRKMPLDQVLKLNTYLSSVMDQGFVSPRHKDLTAQFWSLILANTPMFSDMVVAASPLPSISASQALQLTLARISAFDLMDQSVIRELALDWSSDFHQQWASVITKLQRAQQSSGITTLCVTARETGYLEAILTAVTKPPFQSQSLQATAAFARGCEDADLALRVLRELKVNGAPQPWAWNWEACLPHVEKWILNPHTEPFVLEALHLGKAFYKPGAWKCQTPAQRETRLGLLRRMSASYLRAAHLTKRQCLRRLQICLDMERRLSGFASAESLAGLVDNVLQQLENGSFGSRERLRWVVDLIEREQGSTCAAQCRTILQGWRDTNAARQGLQRVLTRL